MRVWSKIILKKRLSRECVNYYLCIRIVQFLTSYFKSYLIYIHMLHRSYIHLLPVFSWVTYSSIIRNYVLLLPKLSFVYVHWTNAIVLHIFLARENIHGILSSVKE